jgi:selenocysteine lyase/cysteine desulfurase
LTAPATPAAFRSNFPSLSDTVYLASCSLGPQSQRLEAMMGRLLDDARQGGEAAWSSFGATMDQVRSRFAAMIGAAPEDVALLPNATVGAFQVASTTDWHDRPVILISEEEFPSLAHVWLAQRPRGAVVRHLSAPGGRARVPDYRKALAGDTRAGLVSAPLVSYRDGARLPIRRIAEVAHAHGARLFCDAYQALGTEVVRVDELNCDYLVAGTSKYLLGLPGLAFLYVRPGLAPAREPELAGWFGQRDPFGFDAHRLDFADGARRFETGTPSVASGYAAMAGFDLLDTIDPAAVRPRLDELHRQARGLLEAAGVPIATPAAPEERGPMLAVRADDPAGLASWLAGRKIVVSPRGAVVRLAFHYFTSEEDVETACGTITEYHRTTRNGGTPS